MMNINKIISEEYKKILTENIDEDDVEQWISGDCIPFAVALNEIFPEYNIAVLNDEIETETDEDIEYNFNFVHAFCYHPNNSRIIIDAKGIRPIKELYDDFYDINPVIDWEIPNSKFLIDNFAGKEFYSEESYDYDVSEYENAKAWIKENIQYYQIK